MKNKDQKENRNWPAGDDELSEEKLDNVPGGTVKGVGPVISGAATLSSSVAGTLGNSGQGQVAPIKK